MDIREMNEWLFQQRAKEPNENAKRPMSAIEYQRLQRLAKCRFLPGSFDKTFVHNLAQLSEGSEISHRQAWWIAKLWHRYRKQLGHNEVQP